MSGGQRKPEKLKFWELERLMKAPDASKAIRAFSEEEKLRQEAETQRFLEKRSLQLAADWIGYHTHQIETIKKDSAALIKGHLAEVRRYQEMLGIKPKAELKDVS